MSLENEFQFYEEDELFASKPIPAVENKDSKPRKSARKIILHVLLCIIFFPAIILALAILARSIVKVYHSRRSYRKVIKKGLFFDTEYWIEK